MIIVFFVCFHKIDKDLHLSRNIHFIKNEMHVCFIQKAGSEGCLQRIYTSHARRTKRFRV